MCCSSCHVSGAREIPSPTVPTWGGTKVSKPAGEHCWILHSRKISPPLFENDTLGERGQGRCRNLNGKCCAAFLKQAEMNSACTHARPGQPHYDMGYWKQTFCLSTHETGITELLHIISMFRQFFLPVWTLQLLVRAIQHPKRGRTSRSTWRPANRRYQRLSIRKLIHPSVWNQWF